MLSFNSVRAQTFPEIEFQTFTDKNGLSHHYCNKLAQDKNGLIWIGTKNGVSRYDGTRFKSFTGYLNGKHVIGLGNIYNVVPTKTGGIWLGSDKHIFYLNTLDDSYYQIGKQGNLFTEHQSVMLRTPNNYYKLPDNATSGKIKLNPLIKGKNESNTYYEFVYDRKGNIWSWGNGCLLKLNPKTRTVIKKYFFKKEVANGFQRLYFDYKNRMWVSTWGKGVYLFNPKTEKLDRVHTVLNNEYVALGFSSWNYQGKNYIIVLGDASLVLIDEETLAVKMYEDTEGRIRIFDAMQDKQGNLWLATEFGLKFISSEQNFAKVYSIPSQSLSNQKFQKAVTSIAHSKEGFAISKRWFDGVYEFDNNWKLKRKIARFESFAGETVFLNSSDILGIQIKGKATYYSGYYGLYKLDAAGKISRIVPSGFEPYKALYLEEFAIESKQVWWIKHNKGVFKFNPLTDEFTANYLIHSYKSDTLQINSILLTKNKTLLVGTAQGLYRLNRSKKRFELLKIRGLKDEPLYGMCEDGTHHIWVMTNNGLAEINLETKQFYYKFVPQVAVTYSKKLCVDKYNNIWFHTSVGYWCYIQQEKQTAKFGYDLGLPDNRLEWFSMEMKNDKDGFVYAGARDAVVRFNPDFIKHYKSNVEVLITDIFANNKRMHTATINNIDMLELASGNYLFKLSFSVPDYRAKGNYELYYNLVSDDEKWVKTQNGVIMLNNLSHGSYLIRLKGKNNFTGRFTAIKIIRIKVNPFWWQTWWFFTLFFIALCLLIWGISRYVWMQRIKAHKLRRKIQESEMKTLRSQMNPHFVFNTLNAINNFIVKNNTDRASDYLTLFSRLMRNILENSQQEFISLEKEIQTLNMYLKLEHVRLNESFDYEVIIDENINEGSLLVPPLIIQPYCENSIWHGLRNKRGKGSLKVKVSQLAANEYQFIIEDDGIGCIESGKLKQNQTEHKSYGLQITEQRLKMINHENSVEIIDLYNENGAPIGTRVVLTLQNMA